MKKILKKILNKILNKVLTSKLMNDSAKLTVILLMNVILGLILQSTGWSILLLLNQFVTLIVVCGLLRIETIEYTSLKG